MVDLDCSSGTQSTQTEDNVTYRNSPETSSLFGKGGRIQTQTFGNLGLQKPSAEQSLIEIAALEVGSRRASADMQDADSMPTQPSIFANNAHGVIRVNDCGPNTDSGNTIGFGGNDFTLDVDPFEGIDFTLDVEDIDFTLDVDLFKGNDFMLNVDLFKGNDVLI